jgi:hypothetical protein
VELVEPDWKQPGFKFDFEFLILEYFCCCYSQLTQVLEVKSLINQIVQANVKMAGRLEKVKFIKLHFKYQQN